MNERGLKEHEREREGGRRFVRLKGEYENEGEKGWM